MRVLMLGWELPPYNSGGLGVACLQLSKALSKAGADIEFILPYYHQEEYDHMSVKSPSKDFILATRRSSIYGSDKINAWQTLEDETFDFNKFAERVSAEGRFDVIHAHDWLTFRAAILAKQSTGLPLILHVHSIERDRAGGKDGNPMVREIEATAMLLADRVFTVSQRTKDMIIVDYAIPAGKIEVIHNSLEVESVERLDEDNAYNYLMHLKTLGWKVVANVGRLTIQKGLTHLLSAAEEVVKHVPQTVFLFVGDGDQRNELVELAAQKKLSKNVIFTGFQRGKQWRDAYAVADLFVMPSVSEPFGLTPYEAAAYHTAALVSRQSGVAEVFSNCLKIDFWDVNEMANKIVSVLQNDPLQQELQRRAHQEFLQLGWASSASKIMKNYHYLANGVPV